MNHLLLIAIAIFGFSCSPASPPSTATSVSSSGNSTEAARTIYINGQPANMDLLQSLERQYYIRVEPGSYWYDRVSGLWGYWGQGNAGYIPAGLNLGGPLPRNASGGSTNVIVNGRAIHPTELRYLRSLGPVNPGRYWLDSRGNYGYEGGRRLGNLAQAASARNQGSTFFRNGYTGIGGGSSGGTSYVIGDGFSVITD